MQIFNMINSKTNVHNARRLCPDGTHCSTESYALRHSTNTCSTNEGPKTGNAISPDFANVQEATDRCHGSYIVNTELSADCFELPNMVQDMSIPPFPIKSIKTEERQTINEFKTDNVKENKTSNKHYHEKREQAAFLNHEKIIQSLIKQRDSLSSRIHCSNTSDDNKNQIMIDILERQIREYRSHWFVYGVSKSTATETLANDKTELSKQLEREIYRLESHLPIFAKRPEIEKYVSGEARVVIMHGPSGCGKRTQIPQYLADHPQFHGKRIICTQPQKAAAICMANRISFEYNVGKIPHDVHDQIGYEVEGLKKEVKHCRIEVLTEGVLLNRIAESHSDIFKNVGCVIIDEAQERGGNCDILLGYLKTAISLRRDLFIIIISMTNDLGQYFDGAPCLEVGNNIIFPRDIEYRPLKENDQIANEVAQCALDIHVNQGVHSGDVLCFLPGDEDVFIAHRIFERQLSLIEGSHNLLKTKCLIIHEKIEADQLAHVFANLGPKYRKIIFSTNVAETSISVDGIDIVIDCGVKRETIFDAALNGSYETVSSISKTSATQRTEKCGTARIGSCCLLYSQSMFANLQIDTQQNMYKKSLTMAVLTLRKLKIDPNKFDWINALSKDSSIAAEKELKYLGALDAQNVPSELGELILTVQLEPKVVKMIYSGCRHGFGYAAIKLAYAMYVSDFVFWPQTDKKTESKDIVQHQVSDNSFPEYNIVSLYKYFDTWMNIWNGVDETLKALNLKRSTNNKTGSHWERNVSDWCSKNFINGEAMKLAYSFGRYLISQFKDTKVWRCVLSQSKTPSDSEICWLTCFGYFLNAAVLDDSKNLNGRNEYVAIQSDIRGTLENDFSFQKSSSKLNQPQWIIYHKIVQSSANTTFSFANMIDISWIREENREFYDLCNKKEMILSRTIITKNLSHECLPLIFGKRFSNLKIIEKQLDCNITVEPSTGREDINCRTANKDEIENAIDAMISAAVSKLENQVVEVEYLNGTSALIGNGFEVLDILFPQEFATLYITNLPQEYAHSNLKSLLTGENESLGDLEIQNHLGQLCTATAKFCCKKDAKSAYERLSNKFIGNEKIEVFPKFGAARPISQSMSTYLKLSWALEISNGLATIEFYSPQDANNCIENIGHILPQARITRVHGLLENSATTSGTSEAIKLLPPICRIRTPINSTECKFRFIINKEIPYQEEIHYKITIKDLPLTMDECEIKGILRTHNPKLISVSRGTGRMERLSNKFKLTQNEKKEKLSPLPKHLKHHITTAEFLESKTHRAGIYIRFKNNSDAKEAFNQADYTTLRTECHQPHRLEIEYTHSVSIHKDLLKTLNEEFTALQMKAYEKRIQTTQIISKEVSKMVILRLQTNRQSKLLWVQEHLQNIIACKQFKDARLDLLFTNAGKQQMDRIANTAFIRWNWNDGHHCINIYGSPDLKEKKETEIKNIIECLSSMEILDKIVEVDTNKFGVHFFSSQCKKAEVSFHHLLGDKLYLSGSEDSVKKVENDLRQSDMLKKPTQTNQKGIVEICPCELCFCVPDNEFLITILCHHLFCIGCLRPLLKLKPIPLPIVCPAKHCHLPLSINDILKCDGINNIRSILEASVFDYLSKHETEILPCPKPGCGQIFSYKSIATGQNGGELLFCDECVTTYCLICSKKFGKPTKSHEPSHCEDVQNGVHSQITQHIKEIRENCLNLKCPRCDMTFVDFEGCAAVKCDRCNCGFCGLCLQDCGVDAHSHVYSCQKNTTNGVYIEARLLNNIHKSKRKRDVRNYISKISDDKIRNNVCEAIQEDLIDLGIEESFIRSLFVKQNTTNPVSLEIQHHINIIQERILNMPCPRCREQFFEFDGSVAVKCDRCNCAFCTLCMEDCGKFDDIKSHIEKCPKNLTRTLFVDKNSFDGIHRSVRKHNMKVYVDSISNAIIRNGVCKGIEKDLVDLGIEKSFITELSANCIKPPIFKKRSTNSVVCRIPFSKRTSCSGSYSSYTSAPKQHASNVYLMTVEDKNNLRFNQQQQVINKNESTSRFQSQNFRGLDQFLSLQPPNGMQTKDNDTPTYAQILNRRAEMQQRETNLIFTSVAVEQSRHVTNNEDFMLICLVSLFCLYIAYWLLG